MAFTRKKPATSGKKTTKGAKGSKPAGKKGGGEKGNAAMSFKEAMAKNKKALAEAAKSKADDFTNKELIEALGLKKGGKGLRVVGRLEKSRVGADGQGHAFIAHDFAGTRGDADGFTWSKYYGIKDSANNKEWKAANVLEQICKDYQRLDFETTDEDGEPSIDVDDMIQIAKELTKEKPVVACKLSLNDDGYLNCYILEKLSDEEAEEDGEEEEESEDEETEEEESEEETEEEEESEEEDETEEDESEEEESEDEEDATPKKDDVVKFKKPKGVAQKGEFHLVKVLKGKCLLKNVKTKKQLKDISIKLLEVVFEEEDEE